MPPCPSPTPRVYSNSCPSSVMPSNHPILCPPLLLPTSVFPSIRVFSNESAIRIRWPNYWSFSFSINLSNEYSGLISFRMDWLDLLAVQGTLKSPLQHHNSKASILRPSAFFTVQVSRPYNLQVSNKIAWASLVAQRVKRPPAMWETRVQIPEGNGKPLQYSCLENSTDGGAC